jgi:hypothetical protein
MPRPESPEGKWVTVPVRLREADVARIDAVRGEENRSQWARGAVQAALQVEGAYALKPPAGSSLADPDEQARMLQDVATREPDGTPRKSRKRAAAPKTVAPAAEGVPAAAFQEPPEPAPEPRQRAACKHPGVPRKGLCRHCGAFNT